MANDYSLRTLNALQAAGNDALYCPPEVETATGTFDPAGYDENDCAGCGCPRWEHLLGPVAEQPEEMTAHCCPFGIGCPFCEERPADSAIQCGLEPRRAPSAPEAAPDKGEGQIGRVGEGEIGRPGNDSGPVLSPPLPLSPSPTLSPEEALSRGEAWLILGLLALVLGLPEEALSTVEAVLMVGLLLLAVGLRGWRG